MFCNKKVQNIFNRSKFRILLLFLFSSYLLSAQSTSVKGTVIDSKTNEPVPGVSVLVKGTTTGAITEFDGTYVIKAKVGEFLARGIYGQYIYINQPENIVIISTAADRNFKDEGVDDLNIDIFRKLSAGL